MLAGYGIERSFLGLTWEDAWRRKAGLLEIISSARLLAMIS